MRQLLVITNTSNGLYLFRTELLKELSKSYAISVITSDTGSIDKLMEIGCRITLIPIETRGMNPIKDASLVKRFLIEIGRIKPDLVITYTIKPNIYGGVACTLKKVPYAVNITGLGTAFQGNGALRMMVTGMYKAALRKAKVVFFENSANRDLFIREKIVKIRQVCLLNGAGVNLEKFPYMEYPDNEIFHFLFIGRVMKEKGIDELFEAMQRLIAEGQKCFLDVVGPFEEDYEEKLDRFEKEGWLKYHGFQKDVRPFIKACDCFVLPSYHEGMANTNLECAASGRPIITSDIPGCKEAVINKTSGLLCEPKNTESLYIAMKKMTTHYRANRNAMGIAGRKHMENCFDKRVVVNNTMKRLFGF